MNSGGASSPSGLKIPPAASPAGSNNTITGRPPLWTKSSQRKVSRLYLYTTLSLTKIIEVVHAKSPETAPGRESANKKLNALLDKEPRWLHPRTESDMTRRLNELSLSPTRSLSNRSSSPRTHAASDPPLYPNPDQNTSTRETAISPTSLEVPVFDQFTPSQLDFAPAFSPTFGSAPGPAPGPALDPAFDPAFNPAPEFASPPAMKQEPGKFSEFLRRTTFMSTSTQDTQRTTGSLQRVLADYSEPYVRTVRKLIKRYTAPLNHRAESLSPISDMDFRPSHTSWINDPDAPPSLTGKPHLLPGDFLRLDHLSVQQPQCFQTSKVHEMRLCLCFAMEEVKPSLFIAERGVLTPLAHRISHDGLTDVDMTYFDSFNNSVLHFLAARGWIHHIVDCIGSGQCNDILNARNTAGQTFLHVLNSSHPHSLLLRSPLLQLLRSNHFNFSAQDHYGRTVWHQILADEMSHLELSGLLTDLDVSLNIQRDAFDIDYFGHQQVEHRVYLDRLLPRIPSNLSPGAQTDRDLNISEEAKLLECVRMAMDHPHNDCWDGRNGLHCLAATTLSSSSLLRKYGFDNAPPLEKRRKSQEPRDLDSSTDRMTVRLELLVNLLNAGVDPNHYDRNGNTPLMAFVALLPEDDDYKIGPEILTKLIKSGAEVNARNRRGETALHIAVRCGRKLAVRALCQNGANVHVRDSAGRSLLEVTDAKMKTCHGQHTKEYAHYEACRAWLSGKAETIQSPTLMHEWGSS